MAYEYLDSGNDDGVVIGRDNTSKFAVFGATPTTQASNIANLQSTAISTSQGYMIVSSTWCADVTTKLNAINDILKRFGFEASS